MPRKSQILCFFMPKYMIFYANFYAHQLYFMIFLCYTEKEGIYPEIFAKQVSEYFFRSQNRNRSAQLIAQIQGYQKSIRFSCSFLRYSRLKIAKITIKISADSAKFCVFFDFQTRILYFDIEPQKTIKSCTFMVGLNVGYHLSGTMSVLTPLKKCCCHFGPLKARISTPGAPNFKNNTFFKNYPSRGIVWI